MTERELARLAELADGSAVLEIGSKYGASTVAIAKVAKVFHAVDPHVPRGEKTTLVNLARNLVAARVFEQVTLHVGWSWDVVPLFPEGTFDLAFVDAAHQAEPVARDLELVRRVTRRGGTLAFHDYGLAGTDGPDGWEPFGVTEVVDRFAEASGQPIELVDTLAIVRND